MAAIFIDHGVPVADDRYEPNGFQGDAADLGTKRSTETIPGLIMAETAKKAGDWFKFTVPKTTDSDNSVVYSFSVRIVYSPAYGSLDLLAKDAHVNTFRPVQVDDVTKQVTLMASTGSSFTYYIFVAGKGIIPNGSLADVGGDYSPDYDLIIDLKIPKALRHWEKTDYFWFVPGHRPVSTIARWVGISSDPNDKATVGMGPDGWVRATDTLTYTIRFENMASAELAAQEVVVTDYLDPKLDWSTLELKEFGFNNVRVEIPPGLQNYSTRVNVSTDPNPVSVDIVLDPDTGLLTWRMQSVDVVTGLLPEDPVSGFLPPNNAAHAGEGRVLFTIRPFTALASGTQIYNQARIVFDVNEPIDTNKVVNTIDAVAPISRIQTPSGDQGSAAIFLTWLGLDDKDGSGIGVYDVFVSTDGGPYEVCFGATAATSGTFIGLPSHAYSFYALARDLAGNAETTPQDPTTLITLWDTEKFSLYGKDNKRPFIDEDGTPVTVQWTGAGTAGVERWLKPGGTQGDLYSIVVNGSDPKSSLSIKPSRGETDLDLLQINGPVNTLSLKGVNLMAGMTLASAPAKLDLGNIPYGADIVVGPGSPAGFSFSAGRVEADSRLISQAPLKTLKAVIWAGGDIIAPWIGSLAISGDKRTLLPGDFGAAVAATGQGVQLGKPTVSSVTIAGAMSGSITLTGGMGSFSAGAVTDGQIFVSGDIKSITTGRTAPQTHMTAGGAIGSITIRTGDLAGTIVANGLNGIGKITVSKGGLNQAAITAGHTGGLGIKSFTVTGGVTQGAIVSAGTAGTGTLSVKGGADGLAITTTAGKLGKLFVGGNLAGLSSINAFSLGAIEIRGDLRSDARYAISLTGSLDAKSKVTITGDAAYGAGQQKNRIKVGGALLGQITAGTKVLSGMFGDVVIMDSLNSKGKLTADTNNDTATLFADTGGSIIYVRGKTSGPLSANLFGAHVWPES